jgi:PqqD family protein of HPr-rel-A system
MPADALRIVPLDDLTLIYHRASGMTHIVAPPAPEILAALGQAPITRDALFAALAAAFDLDGGDATALTARLDELVAAGLVEAL